ncbi:MAG: hypothetical protein QM737_10550 [Ferruginibacter sp.]
MAKKKKEITMEELTKNYSTFIKGKEINKNGKDLFDKTLKKAVKPRSSK